MIIWAHFSYLQECFFLSDKIQSFVCLCVFNREWTLGNALVQCCFCGQNNRKDRICAFDFVKESVALESFYQVGRFDQLFYISCRCIPLLPSRTIGIKKWAEKTGAAVTASVMQEVNRYFPLKHTVRYLKFNLCEDSNNSKIMHYQWTCTLLKLPVHCGWCRLISIWMWQLRPAGWLINRHTNIDWMANWLNWLFDLTFSNYSLVAQNAN